MPTCADMCRHVKPLSAPLISTIWNLSWMLACVSTFGHADMCWYVPTCDINLDTSYSDHLDLIWMLACVSICGHVGMCWYVPTCAFAGMCQHVKPLSPPLIPIIWNLSCMLACVSKLGHADMCQHVLTYADMCQHMTLTLTPLLAII